MNMLTIILFFKFQKGSVFNAGWPVVGQIDNILIQSSQYLMDAAHSFRVRLINHSTAKTKKSQKGPAASVEKPTCGIIYVAKTWPAWQSSVLTTMKELYTVNNTFNNAEVINFSSQTCKHLMMHSIFRNTVIVYQKIKFLLLN